MPITRRSSSTRFTAVHAVSAAILVSLPAGCGPAPPESPQSQDVEPETPATAGGLSTSQVAPPPKPAAPLPPLPTELREAAALSGRGDLDGARDRAQAYVDAHPDDGRGAFILGLVLQRGDNHGPAVAQFDRALEQDPSYYLTHLYRGDSVFRLGDLRSARLSYEAYGAAQPGEPLAVYSIGLVDLEEGDLDAAERRFRQALALFERMRHENPRLYQGRPAARARCHARLADVHFARDEYEAARDELLESTRIAPANISAFHTLSLVYRRLGEDAMADRAERRYEDAKRAIIERSRGAGGG